MAELMEEAFGEPVQIESQIIIDRSGGNFGCEVLRMVIKTESDKEYFLIVKRMPDDEDTSRMVLESGVMKREAVMYGRILKSFSINIPLCYLARQDALVLQDMYSVGYKTGSRITGLDLDHCRLALKQLAKFHAGSVIARCRDPELFQKEMTHFPEPIYTEENREVMTHYMKTSLMNIADTLRGHEQLRYTVIAEEIEMLADSAYDAMIEAVTRYTKVLVLTHGDFWVGNLLFRYEDEKPVACCVIDFQVGRCGSPALDLMYFFCTSCTGETRRNHLHELLQLYLHEARLALRNSNIETQTDELNLARTSPEVSTRGAKNSYTETHKNPFKETDELKNQTERNNAMGDELNLAGTLPNVSTRGAKNSNTETHKNPFKETDELKNQTEKNNPMGDVLNLAGTTPNVSTRGAKNSNTETLKNPFKEPDELKIQTDKDNPIDDGLGTSSKNSAKDSNIVIAEPNLATIYKNPFKIEESYSDESKNTDEIKLIETNVDEVGIDVVQTADELQCQFYTDVEQLRDELHELALFGLLAACLVLPPALQTGDEDSLYEGKLFQARFHELLDELDDDGLFEQLRKQRL